MCDPPLWPTTKQCGFYGDCISSICHCQPGYTSIADFSFSPAAMCDFNLVAIQFLWGMLCGLYILAIIQAFHTIIIRIADYKMNKTRTMMWKRLIVPVLIILQFCCFFPLAINKALDATTYIVGRDVAATVLYSFGSALCWAGLMYCIFQAFELFIKTSQAQLLSNIEESNNIGHMQQSSSSSSFTSSSPISTSIRRTLDTIVTSFTRWMPFMIVWNTCWSFMPMMLLSDSSLVYVAAALHSLGLGCSMLLAFPASRALGVIENILAQAINRSPNEMEQIQLNQLHSKMSKVRKTILSTGIAQIIIAILFGVWPWLIHHLTYQFPLAWSNGIILQMGFLWMTYNRKKPSSESSSTGNQHQQQQLVSGGGSLIGNNKIVHDDEGA
jgi:hypothetical protein